jgi:hypothetical protein
MATAYNSIDYANNVPAGTGHGVHKTTTHLHSTSGKISTWVANDTITFGYLPRNAVVTGCVLKAATQLDSNVSGALAFDLGITGTAQLFKAAVTTVGQASGASADNTIAAGGLLYKNTTGAPVAVVATVHTAAGTAVAGTLECNVTYFVEDAAGSAP